ncbi:MAG: hypothetical protein HQL07_04425 [Nitrospirae bacterium]|nr:hypothetical protein [Magnetococcales bacterium]HAT50733.1 hypothetical protein [Alphaproteobacteria bacterium]
MAGEKFPKHNGSGLFEETEAVQEGGPGSANKIAALDNSGRWATTMMPPGIGADTTALATSEDLASGDLVNIYDVAGTPTARKANASDTTKPCDGFVLAASTAPGPAIVYLEGPIVNLSGLTAGTRMFLSAATSGALTATPPTGGGKVVQYVGKAVNATTVNFEPEQPIKLA